jgi:hypothetical protein
VTIESLSEELRIRVSHLPCHMRARQGSSSETDDVSVLLMLRIKSQQLGLVCCLPAAFNFWVRSVGRRALLNEDQQQHMVVNLFFYCLTLVWTPGTYAHVFFQYN